MTVTIFWCLARINWKHKFRILFMVFLSYTQDLSDLDKLENQHFNIVLCVHSHLKAVARHSTGSECEVYAKDVQGSSQWVASSRDAVAWPDNTNEVSRLCRNMPYNGLLLYQNNWMCKGGSVGKLTLTCPTIGNFCSISTSTRYTKDNGSSARVGGDWLDFTYKYK